MKRELPRGTRPRRRRLTALAVGLPLALSGLALPAHAAPDITPSAPPSTASSARAGAVYQDGRYIVVLAEQAVAAYEGTTAGYAATKPSNGRKVDAGAPNVKAYDAHLRKKQRDVAAQHGVGVGQQFTTALNGFTAQLTAAQAAQLAKDPQVLTVAEDTQSAPDYTSNDFMKLTGPQGSWATQFGGKEGAGKGTVVGVIDTGYTPSNPFLTGDPVAPLAPGAQPQVGVPYRDADGSIAMLKGDGQTFKGQCQKGVETGASFDGSACNSKVLSARYFADAFLATVPPAHRAPQELISPVDVASHGTHTASTAAGNADVHMTLAGTDFGTSSGVAPAAKVAAYKVCWEDDDPSTGGCYSSATVAAVDAAITDGVDVLNFSISGNTNSTTDPVALAFLNAASAGIFVAASAGNSGPAASTVNHAAPWLTTVAASTFPSTLVGTVVLSDGSKYRGATVMNTGVDNKQPILAADAAVAGAQGSNLCLANTLDPAKVTGKVVVCDRGVNARVDKSAEVKRAGGVGMVLVNLTPSSEDSDLHSVPTIHVNAPEGPELKAKVAADPTLTVSLVKGDLTGKPAAPAPQIAGFSSRGPSLASGGDLLKPDISAPGVNVLAGVSPIGNHGEQFGFMSGTSMAAPHIAGVGALVLGKNPTWSPAVVKSAMMTTAYPLVNADGTAHTNPFDGGAGHVDTTKVTDPGLVFDSGSKQWTQFLNGQGYPTGSPQAGSLEAKDVNVPSIALGSLVGEVQVKRQVTALVPGMYRPKVDLPGVNVHVEPQALNFAKAGQTREITITISNASAPLGKYATGSLSWVGPRTVTEPMAVRPVDAKVEPGYSFSSATGTGSGTFTLTSGSDAPIPVAIEGLAPVSQQTVTKTPGGQPAATNNASNALVAVTVPAGQKVARFGVKAANPNSDWDMYVFAPNGSGGFKQYSAATGSASEYLELGDPLPGTYYIVANLFATPDGGPSDATVLAAAWAGDAGNATVTPNPIVAANGTQATETLSWTGLAQGAYMGRLSFGANGIRSWVDVNVGSGAAAGVPAGATQSAPGAPAMASADSVPGQ